MDTAATEQATIWTQPVSKPITPCAFGAPWDLRRWSVGSPGRPSRSSSGRSLAVPRSTPAVQSWLPTDSGMNPWNNSVELCVPRWPAKASAERWNRSATWWSGGGGLVRPLTPLCVTQLGEGHMGLLAVYFRPSQRDRLQRAQPVRRVLPGLVALHAVHVTRSNDADSRELSLIFTPALSRSDYHGGVISCFSNSRWINFSSSRLSRVGGVLLAKR